MEQIEEIISGLVSKAVNEKLTKYIEYISREYDISQRLLLQDLENIDSLSLNSPKDMPEIKDGQCKGFTQNKKRCTRKGKKDGYCIIHFHQKKEVRPTIQTNPNIVSLVHNHSFSDCLFKVGCPACEKSKRVPSKENLLIDL